MSRPARRPSALAGSSTFDHPVAAETPQDTPAAPLSPEGRAADPHGATAAQGAPESKRPAAKQTPKKLTIYQESADTDRMRGAMVATIPYEGFKTLSRFAQEAIMEKVERLEQQYNHGEPFPPVGPGIIPAGRPMGE